MEKNLLLEVNNIRNIMGLDPINQIIESIEDALIKENESLKKDLLFEYTIRPKNIKLLWDDLWKMGDDILDDNIARKFKDVFDEDILIKFKNLDNFINLRKEINEIFDSANPGYGVQSQRDQLVKLLDDKKISKAVNDGFDGFIEGLEKDIRNYKLSSGETLETFLRKRQETITGLYEELEKETSEIIGDPKSHNITDQSQMDDFVNDFKNTFGDDLPFTKNADGDDVLTKTMKKTFDPDNINIKNIGDEFDPNLDAPTKSRLEKFKDDLVTAFKSFDVSDFKGILSKLFKWIMKTYDLIFNKFVYANAMKRRQKWLNSDVVNKIDKNSNFYKYGAKPAIIGFNKIITAFDSVLAANTTFLIPVIRTVRRIFWAQSEILKDYPKIKGFIDGILGWFANIAIYVWSYFPTAFWEGDRARAEEARNNMAGVQTMMSFVGVDTTNTVEYIDHLADWLSKIPCKLRPKKCAEYKAELDELQKTADDAKKTMRDLKVKGQIYTKDSVENLKTSYSNAKNCLDSLGEKKAEFLKDLKGDDSNPDRSNDPSVIAKNNVLSNFENGNISMYDMIKSVEGLIDGIISNKNEDGALEAGLIQTESDGYLKEILEKCKELKNQKTVIINGGKTKTAKGFSD